MQFLVEPVGKVTAQVTRETACPPDKAGRMQGERLGFATKSTPRRHRVSAQAAHRFYASCAPCQPVQVRKVRGFASKARVLAKLLDCLVKLQVAPLPTCQNLTFRRISPSWPAKVPSRVEPPQVLGKTHVSGADCFRKLQVVPPVCYQKLWFVLLALMWLHAGYMSRKPCTAVCKQSVNGKNQPEKQKTPLFFR